MVFKLFRASLKFYFSELFKTFQKPVPFEPIPSHLLHLCSPFGPCLAQVDHPLSPLLGSGITPVTLKMAPKGGARQRFLARSRTPAPPSPEDDPGAASSGLERGGARQRLARAQPLPVEDLPAAATDPGIQFKNHIAHLFLKNRFSGPETVELIQKAYGAHAEGLDELLRAGGAGRHMQNSRRDLMRALLKGCKMPDLYWADIPVWNGNTNALELLPFPFILPHEVCLINKSCVFLQTPCGR